MGVGLPLAAVCALKPVHEGGALLGTNCGPAISALFVHPASSSEPAYIQDMFGSNQAAADSCHHAAAPWVVLAVLIALLAGGLALVLGLAVKRRPPQVVYVPYVPPPPG